MLKKYGRAAGFTDTETKALIFLIIIFFAGLIYKHFYQGPHDSDILFNYSEQDSMFFAAVNGENDSENLNNISNKVVDYKQEVLDFNKQDFKVKRTSLLKEKSININTAGLTDLIQLPGIGEATAKNIVKYRDTYGNFRNLEELMNVKRIGEKRFGQIKKFLFIEKLKTSFGAEEK
jgi:competence ComEA-like helix-hairpin-helix protein